MSKLGDLLKGRKEEAVVQKQEAKEEVVQEIITYNRVWLNRMSDKYGYIISNNTTKVDNILKALNKRDGHCPCGGMTEEFCCPCRMMREHGACKCGLYNDVVSVNPVSETSAARIKGRNS